MLFLFTVAASLKTPIYVGVVVFKHRLNPYKYQGIQNPQTVISAWISICRS
ncbi:hypothetical protein TPHV1_210079 [Treponema phagedenis]|uniref:Uncharacterized protein n=1 Tax=Treponema phagedenis TaxID=162 RepID=A0A0B7GYV3_TREPH|nr:hypothetical protein TPHV1_210079 [Treponema phagedenis]